MSENEQRQNAKRLMTVAAKATTHASKRIRRNLPAMAALKRAIRLGNIARDAMQKAMPC